MLHSLDITNLDAKLTNYRQRGAVNGPLKMERCIKWLCKLFQSVLINEVRERVCLFADDKGSQKKLKLIEIIGKLPEKKPLCNSVRDKSKVEDLHRETQLCKHRMKTVEQ